MYNRYIPQPDGSYRRNRMPEPRRPEPKSHPAPPPKQDVCPPPPEQREQPPPKKGGHTGHKVPISRQETGIGSFLKQILPKDLDTGDLLIILLLLLMAGDCAEDQNTAMLTLALYLFM